MEKNISKNQSFNPAFSDHSDTEITSLIKQEEQRQVSTINLIASENHTSPAVRKAMASMLTDKYAEGNANKRYYEGCQVIDQVEIIAIERLKKLFGADHANVQPHAGSQANQAVYHAILKPGDTILGMKLDHGGHLTHGHPMNASGVAYNCIQYGLVPETELIDYDQVERLALEHKPKLIIAGASAYSRPVDFKRFSEIAKKVDAYFLADIAHIAGLVIAGLHQNPFPYADFATSTTHKTLRGPRGGVIMCKKEFAEKIDKAIMPGVQGGPFMHAIAAKAIAFHEAGLPEFTTYQKQVVANAQTLATELQSKGYRIVSGGTDNHLMIVDLTNKNITGSKASKALAKAGIVTSKSTIPNDPTKPWVTSGIRIGSPALTTRGMKQADVKQIAAWIDEAITHHDDDAYLAILQKASLALCAQFPLP